MNTPLLETSSSGGAISGKKESILVVEDEEAVQKLIARILEMNGFVPLTARCGAEAFRVSQEYKEPIDILITDVKLDRLMSGCQLARQMRRDRNGIKVLYITGYPDSEIDSGTVVREVRELLATFLPKPFSPAELVRRVRYMLDKMPT